MRKSATENSQGATVVSLSAIQSERLRALSPFGPVKAGLINSLTTQEAQLTELLNCLEKKVEILVSKSYEVLDILKQDMEKEEAVGLFPSTTDEDITDER